MTRLALIAPLFLLTLFAPAAHADGCPPSTCGTSGSAEPGSRYLTLRTNGQIGPLVLYDVVARRQHVALPKGLVSADGRTFVSARTLGKRATVVTRYALPSGRTVATRRLPGVHWLSAISPNGRRVLLQFTAPRGFTRYAVLDGMRVTRAISLRGNYEVETLSPDGQRVFLVHWGANGRYDLRRFDLRTNKLSATPTRSSETGEVEKMQGSPWVGLPSRSGNWLLTLYVKEYGSFIHALDLRAGVGHCIDLEVPTEDLLAIGTAALALSPDERTLYVAMPLAGRIFSIDLRKLEVTRTARFSALSTANYGFGVNPSAAVTPNGRMLYVAAGTRLWGLDTAAWKLRGPRVIGAGQKQLATATGVSPDGRRVVVLRLDQKLVVRDAATLRRIE